MRLWKIFLSLSVLIFLSDLFIKPPRISVSTAPSFYAYFKRESVSFYASCKLLTEGISHLGEKQPTGVREARNALKECRLRYKRISLILDYFFQSEAIVFNSPPKYEIEEPFMEFQTPKGLQVIESLLYTAHPESAKKELLKQTRLVEAAAADLPSLLYDVEVKDDQTLESAYLELIRIMTLYITGYDAPILKSGIRESYSALTAIDTLLTPYLRDLPPSDSLRVNLNESISYLKGHPDFDSFDRLYFLTQYALPLQYRLNRLTQTLGRQLNTVPALNRDAKNLYSPDALDKTAFPHKETTEDTLLVNLGKYLFAEKSLSGSQTRSCASCHQPAAYFSDGLARNRSLDGKQRLARNSMTLLYSCYQYAQFWDGRANSLEEQVKIVLGNKLEMDANTDTLLKRIGRNASCTARFEGRWPGSADPVSLDHLASAIAAYVRTLTPFSSDFDNYIRGDHGLLSKKAQNGFNLFMGKGQCGACHFAPLFNGLTPPLYNRTEYEVIGTAEQDGPKPPHPDRDQGRYGFFPISFYKQAFKTPTVRNAAVTGPYMHNGGFHSLESVVDFYNKGGGEGSGLRVPNQTLSASPLKLTAYEQTCLVAFLKSLTDKPIP